MKVIAKEAGFYGGQLRQPMEVFEFKGKKPGKWMAVMGDEDVQSPGASTKDEDKGPTAGEIKAQLIAAGVPFKGNASRESLLELLKETVEKASPGASTKDEDLGERTE